MLSLVIYCILAWILFNAVQQLRQLFVPRKALSRTARKLLAESPWRGKRVLVFINPFGGAKNGLHLWEKTIHPLFLEAGVDCELMVTKHRGHAGEVISSISLGDYSALICASGDGVIHEVVNAMFQRKEDRAAARQIPVGIIPIGSGNGIAASLGYPLDAIESSAIHMLSSTPRPLDITEIRQKSAINYTVMCVNFGLSADSDLLAERSLRWIPSAYIRNLLAPLYYISLLRKYPCKLKMIPGAESLAENFPYSKLSHLTRDGDYYIIEDSQILVTFSLLTHVASDLQPCPRALYVDGCMDIFIITKKATRFEIFSMFAKAQSGTHLGHPHIDYYKAKRIIFEPLVQDSHLSSDGEQLPYEKLECNVLQGGAKFIY